MNRQDFIAKIASDADITKKAANLALSSVLGGILAALEAGEKVSLVGFGTFSVKKRSSRVGVNPQTKAKISIPSRKVAYFKAGKKLKEAVSNVDDDDTDYPGKKIEML
ncbi:MAG: HU family DNA-binding protein [Armatimonadetes bacterium]|nr:HU family DNA-binding protein [Armatimonadota bacterium]